MKQFSVEITEEALVDMESFHHYIAYTLLSPENAMGQYNRIAEAILKPDIFPERFLIIDLRQEDLKEIRRMPVDNYSVFYVIQEDKVIVTNVLYGASDIGDRLKG